MRVQLTQDDADFTPFTLTLKVENESEARSLWHRFNFSPNNLKKMCTDSQVCTEDMAYTSDAWGKVNNELRKQGMR